MSSWAGRSELRRPAQVCYATWRKIILERDGFRCCVCGAQEKTMHVHHIKPVKYWPELILDFENGITLCKKHHKAMHAKVAHGKDQISKA